MESSLCCFSVLYYLFFLLHLSSFKKENCPISISVKKHSQSAIYQKEYTLMENTNHTVIVSVRIREYLGDELLSAPAGFISDGFIT